jgi:hypothetical protein
MSTVQKYEYYTLSDAQMDRWLEELRNPTVTPVQEVLVTTDRKGCIHGACALGAVLVANPDLQKFLYPYDLDNGGEVGNTHIHVLNDNAAIWEPGETLLMVRRRIADMIDANREYYRRALPVYSS